MIFKICGLKKKESLICCEENKVDFFGMIFYERSPRTINSVVRLRAQLSRESLKIKNLYQTIDYLTEKLRLENLLQRVTGELSSGQKNRVSLAKALINEPYILFLDEPTASLDPEIGDFVRTFLENYKREKKISVLLASHNMNEVTRLCSSVLMMKDGVIIDKGKPKELIAKHGRQNLEEVFLKLTRSKNEI